MDKKVKEPLQIGAVFLRLKIKTSWQGVGALRCIRNHALI